MRATAVVLIVLLAGGCLGAPNAPSASLDAPSAPSSAVAPLLNNSSVPAPAWEVGDAWETTNHNGGTSERATFVVTAASSDAYTLATTSDTMAGFDAAFDISYLGKVRASDLAGAQHDKPVAFFAFPMTDGATWSTTWDGAVVNMSAKFSPSIAAAGGAPGFDIVAMLGQKPYATYDYVPALRWWSHLDFAAGYGLKVDRAVRNWTGQVASATAKEVFNSGTIFPTMTLNTQTFHVDEKQSYEMLALEGGGAHYARAFQLIDPNNQPYSSKSPQTDPQPMGGGVFLQETLPPTPGDWKISAPIAHDNTASFLLTVHEIAIVKKNVP